MSTLATRRVRARVEGTVQGVGFRPFVHRLAAEHGLAGWALNDEHGVLLEVEGAPEGVEAFLGGLRGEPPPLAVIERVRVQDVAARGASGFTIRASARGGVPSAPVTPDSATCEDCLAELWDPGDRRFRYPFVNCTNCGPRFTIVRGVPYDRPRTTMAGFVMCARCQSEYEDPWDRRFHAQPNACPECGPRLRAVGADGDPLLAAATALLAGRIVAIKGLGGYHLACRADDERAVTALRARKHREERPFALMVAGVQAAQALVHLSTREEALLCSPARPIVLAARRGDAAVAPPVAPGAPELGVMLAYTPLHHLLLADVGGAPLVMTSGNVSDEPIAFRDDDALERLAAIADLVLLGDRPIQTRADDSVARIVRGRPLLLRRSRGYVPASVALPVPAARAILGCGAEQKNVFCLARGDRAWPGQHIGDLKSYETLRSFSEGIEHLARLFDVVPEVVAHDLHPDYLSTRWALEREGVDLVGVQHHHAHLAACLAEHGETGAAVGAIFDGTGYGPDGTVWGGELLVGDLEGFERAGHLRAVRMPGGERAIREPWRMACAWLVETTGGAGGPLPGVDAERWSAVARLAATGLSSPVTTSMGRLFDAVAALCAVRTTVSYEGQAAVQLEATAHAFAAGAGTAAIEPYPLPICADLVLDAAPTIGAVRADVTAGAPAGLVSARFHAGVARSTAQACARAAEQHGLQNVALAGGVFANRLLLEATAAALQDEHGLRVLVPERLPVNDGAIAYGQVAVAAARGSRPVG